MQLKLSLFSQLCMGCPLLKQFLLRPLSTGQPSPLLRPKNYVKLNIVKNIIIIEPVYRLVLSIIIIITFLSHTVSAIVIYIMYYFMCNSIGACRSDKFVKYIHTHTSHKKPKTE